MSLNRRQVLAGGLGLGAAVGLGACSGLTSKAGSTAPSSGASGGSGPVELTFVNWSGDAEKAAFDAVIAKFQQANPGITIKTDTVPYASVQTNLDTRFQAGNPPDLFRVSYIDMGQYTSQDVLLDLSDSLDANAFEPGLFQAVVANGKPYGAPHQIDTTAILYRKDAFEAAGITDVPTTLEEAWTWEQFSEAADKLAKVTKKGQSAFIYDWQSAGAYRWLSWLFEAGGALLTPDLKSAAIDSDAGRKALDFTKGFFDKGWVAKNTSVKSTTYPDSAFISGTVAMAFAGSFLVPAVDVGVKKKFEYGAMPQPRDVAASTDLGGNAVVAPKDGKNTEAAAKFLQFLVSEESMRTYCQATNELPTLKSLTSAQLDFDIRPDLMAPFVLQAKTLTPEQVSQVTVPQFADLNLALQNELEKAFLGGRSSADTATALAAAVQKALQ
ncbi:ABC transporter substrate-binding protein [Microlunatus flavus]|uniref:Multiple sugar transport system substrate-binding protein n=1 Tax=Microlunatus flavus TaxID=1036181 RepID=A0A1H8ZYV1_9ACTN|nr:sugar ABC transporter substrate-binding protein [Microlunatus flavus]SEP69431.1 multiple sugar transport system substrate-binding protein [Microlunatus flavus]